MKRIVSIILILALLMTTLSACAMENRASDYFNDYGTSLSKLGNGKIKITFTCGATSTASQLGVSNFSVYRYDGSNWNLVSGPNSGSYGYGVSSYTFSRIFNGVAGEKYYVETTFACVKGGTMETKSHSSGTIIAN